MQDYLERHTAPASIVARNVNDALYKGTQLLLDYGEENSPRGLRTLEYPGTVVTTYCYPEECVLFSEARRINPFFHLMEALWVLNGNSDVATLSFFNKRMSEYSDNGVTFHAPYGQRLRSHFSLSGLFVAAALDQLEGVVKELTVDRSSRRAVACIWDPCFDLNKGGETKDIPCNNILYFKVRDGRLYLTVCCRSNDMIWGAYGTNAVQFSFVLQYVAAKLGVHVGAYTQVSDSFHVYTENVNSPDIADKWAAIQKEAEIGRYDVNPYEVHAGGPSLYVHPLVSSPSVFDKELYTFVNGILNRYTIWNRDSFTEPFLRNVAWPMLRAWQYKKDKDIMNARKVLRENAYNEAGTSMNDWIKSGINFLD